MTEPRRATSFEEWLKSLSFLQWVLLFGTMWASKDSKYLIWHPWVGSRRKTDKPDGYGDYKASIIRGGYEYFKGQIEAIEAIATAVISWFGKARQKGVSEMAAAYAVYVCLTEPKSVVLVFSVDKDGSKAFLSDRVVRKLEGMMTRLDPSGEPYPWTELPWIGDASGKPGKEKIEFKNGSVIEAHSSDNTGPISRSPRLVIFDEIRTYPFAEAKEMWTTMMGARRPRMQAICISTAMSGSWFNEMTKSIISGLISIVEFVFLPDDIDPERDEFWRKQQLEIMMGDETALKREHPLTVNDMFSSHEGLVIGSWDPKVHAVARPVSWKDQEEFYVIYDGGHTYHHPAVALFACYNRYNDDLYIFDEIFLRGPGGPKGKANLEAPSVEITYIGPAIKAKIEMYMQNGAPWPTCIADTAVFSAQGVRTVGEVLAEESGFDWMPAFKHDFNHSLELLQQRYFKGKISHNPVKCANSVEQISNWRYIEDKDKPVELEDDSCDCERYLVSHLNKGERPRVPTPLEIRLRQVAERRARESETAGITQGYGEPGGLNSWMATP